MLDFVRVLLGKFPGSFRVVRCSLDGCLDSQLITFLVVKSPVDRPTLPPCPIVANLENLECNTVDFGEFRSLYLIAVPTPAQCRFSTV
jgi:hypothetical protein